MVGFSVEDGLNEPWDVIRIMGTVSIDEYEHIAARVADSDPNGISFTNPVVQMDRCTQGSGNVSSSVGGMAVNHDDFIGVSTAALKDLNKIGCLILCGNDY